MAQSLFRAGFLPSNQSVDRSGEVGGRIRGCRGKENGGRPGREWTQQGQNTRAAAQTDLVSGEVSTGFSPGPRGKKASRVSHVLQLSALVVSLPRSFPGTSCLRPHAVALHHSPLSVVHSTVIRSVAAHVLGEKRVFLR